MTPNRNGYPHEYRDERASEGPRLIRGWLLVWMVLTALAWFAPPSVGLYLSAGVALYALRGTRQSVEALGMISFLVVLGKTDVVLGRWIVLLAAFGRVAWDEAFSRGPLPPLAHRVLLFCGGIGVLSVLASEFPLVSGLKVGSLAVGVLAMVIGFHRTRHRMDYWLSWVLTLGAFIILASVPLAAVGAGFAGTEGGFQGILTDPQTFGPVLAAVTTLMTGLYLFGRLESRILRACTVLGWIGMYFSLARTSVLAVVLAALGTAVVGLTLRQDSWTSAISRALNRPAILAAALLVIGAGTVQWTSLQARVDAFLGKGAPSTSLVGALQEARGRQMEQSMANFRDRPLTGIGFGVSSDPADFEEKIDRGPYGIPVGASVEKGFLPTAILGETGLIGAGLTLILLFALVLPAVRHPSPLPFWVLTACLLLNMGEMVLFSLGGMGLFLWFVMAFAHVAALEGAEARSPARTRPRPARYANRVTG